MADETQEEEQFEVSERVKARLRGAQWTIEDLRASERTFRDGEDEETGEPKKQVRKRVTLIRKCEWPEKMDAEEAVKYLASPACKEVLRLCGEGLEGKDWEPRFAWFKQDNEQGRARSGYLYHALRLFDAHGEDGPYVVEESCLSRTEATFYWGVKQPPEVPEAESGVTYELNIRGYQDETGEYDCILMRRENLGYNMPVYETHEETGETRLRSEMLGVRDDEDKEGGSTVDEKVADYAEEQGLELEDGPKLLEDGTTVGVVVDLQKQKNRDCTTDVTLQNTHEEKSLEHVVETRETLRGKQTATTHMHVTADEAGQYKPGYKGGTLTVTHVEKTPGGVRNVTVTKTDSTPVEAGDGNTVCAKTIYEHVHTELAENQEALSAREPADVKKWAGKHKQVQVVANDDGTYNQEVKTTTELEVKDSQSTIANAYLESTERKVGANLGESTVGSNDWKKTDQVVPPTAAPATPSNTAGPSTRQPLYQTQREVTPGGKENVTVVTTTPHPATAYIQFKEDYNGRKRRYGWFKNLTEAEANSFCSTFTDGSISRNEYGLFDGTVAETSAGDSGGSGGNTFFHAFDATYHECTTSVQTDRKYQEDDSTQESFDVYVYIETHYHKCGIINDNAQSAYAKCSGAVGPVKVNQLSGPSMVNQGWYEYDYVYRIEGEWKKNGTTIRTEVIASGN